MGSLQKVLMTSVRFVAIVKWQANQKLGSVAFVTVGKFRKCENVPIRKPAVGSLQNVLVLSVGFVVVHEI